MIFIYGFIAGSVITAICGSSFVWMLMATIKIRSPNSELTDLNRESVKLQAARLKQQETIAAQLEEIAHNMVSGYAKVQST